MKKSSKTSLLFILLQRECPVVGLIQFLGINAVLVSYCQQGSYEKIDADNEIQKSQPHVGFEPTPACPMQTGLSLKIRKNHLSLVQNSCVQYLNQKFFKTKKLCIKRTQKGVKNSAIMQKSNKTSLHFYRFTA